MKRFLILVWLLTSPALAWYPSQVFQGDQAMRAGKPAEAEKFYRQALKEKADDPRATYNLATSLYRQGQYKEAGELFHKLVETREPDFVGRAAYNEGNALFQQKKLDEALEAYKVALRWNELDDDARYNIEQLLKQKNQQNQKNNQKDKDKQNQDKDKDKKDQDKKDKDKDKDKNQDKNDQDKDKDKKDQDKDKQNDQKDKNDKDNQDKKDKDQGKQPQPKEPQMSKQDAERLLQYFQQKEDKDAPKARVRQARPPKGTETW